MHFGEICRKAGIPHYVDLSFESPHVALGFVDKQVHLDYWADHPPAEGPTALRLKSDPQISQMGAEGNGLTSAPDGRMLESASGRVPPSPSPGCGLTT
jgi:hypothetical protein